MVLTDLKQMNDEALASLARAGDREALELLLERSAAVAARIAYRLLGNHDEALDVAQVTLMNVAREIGFGWSGTSYRSWLGACAHNAAIDAARLKTNRRVRGEATGLAAQRFNERTIQNCEQDFEKRELLAALREEFSELPRETALVLALHHLDDLPVSDVAAQTGLSVDACKHRLVRGRQELRERLEKRGLALTSILMLSGVNESLARSSDVWLQQVASQTFRSLAQNALAAVSAGGAIAVSATLSTTPSSSTNANAAPNSSPASIFENTAGDSATQAGMRGAESASHAWHWIGGVAIVIMIVVLTMFAVNSPEIGGESTAPRESSVPIKSVARLPQKPSAGPNPDSPVASRWQVPRFLAQGAVSPKLISAAGDNVALVASTWGENGTSNQLYLSADSGKTWSEPETLREDIAGVSIDRKGNCVLLANSGEYAWHVRTHGGKATAAGTVWNFGITPSRNAVLQPADGGHWAFAEVGHMYMAKTNNGPDVEMFGRDKIMIAYGSSNGCPKNVAEIESAKETALVPWALDAKTAGFFTTADNWQTMVHYRTNDGGKTWPKTPIVLPAAPESAMVVENYLPMLASREGKRLALLVMGQFLRKMGNDDDLESQYYLLMSKDLGETWSAAVPVLKMRSSFSADAITGLLLSGETVYLAAHSANEAKGRMQMQVGKPFKGEARGGGVAAEAFGGEVVTGAQGGGEFEQYTTRLLTSNDEGKTWYDHHAFEALGQKSSGPIIAGTKDSIHVALFNEPNPISIKLEAGGMKVDHEAEQYLVVRSYADGKWEQPKTPPPPTFREAKPPEPTREQF